MVDEKGLSPECADRIGQYVRLSGKKIFLLPVKKLQQCRPLYCLGQKEMFYLGYHIEKLIFVQMKLKF